VFTAIRRFQRWFSNLRVAQKLTLISIFFVMPDSVMLYLFITGINANIQFARLEKEGNQYQRPLESLLELVPQYRLLELRPGTDPALLESKQAEIEAAFAILARVDAEIGADLQFTDEGLAKRNRQHLRVPLVRADWHALAQPAADSTPDARAAQYGKLVADIRAMITHAGDMSNLILDPDLDSYYLMDATLLALPQTQDRLARVAAFGERALADGRLSVEERRQVAIDATLLGESDLDRVRGSVQTALNEDPNFYGVSPTFQARVPPVLAAYIASNEHFLKILGQLVTNDLPGISVPDFAAAAASARADSFALWTVADREVDTLLQRRIEDYQFRRAKSLLVAACALLAAIGFVTFITRSISGPLRHQAAELQSANESLAAEIAERKRAEDELRLSEKQLAASQQIAGLGSWEWNLATGSMVWSEENYRIHGVTPASYQPSYRSALEFVIFEDRRASHAACQEALRSGSSFSFEQRIVRHDGAERTLHQRGQTVLGPNGEPWKVIGTAQDVTERKRAEAELEQVHQDLMTASRQAGMAEVATGVLHNVGNVLNSVNVSAMLISDRLGKSRVTHLTNVAGMLRDNGTDLAGFLTAHPKGKMIPGFIQSLAERLAAEQTELLTEADSLAKNISHIKDIVSVQQGYAKVSGLEEMLTPASLVQDALQMNASALERHEIDVVREFADVPPVRVDKHKVLQILTNVIRNAKYAMKGTDRRLVIRIAGAGSRVSIAIADSGIGIAPEDLARIFAFGFTTKTDGHGFGLHSSALAAREMGASLTAASEGLGHGATFTLDLPAAALTRAQPAPLALAAA
jgi:PAS domain S-box-containing protein